MSNYILESLADEVFEHIIQEAHESGKTQDWVDTMMIWHTDTIHDMLDYLGYTSISEYIRENDWDVDEKVVAKAVHKIYVNTFWIDKKAMAQNIN